MMALKAPQARAAAAATVLGLHVDHRQEVRVDVRDVFPVRPMMAMAARAAPEVTAVPQVVTTEVSADLMRRP